MKIQENCINNYFHCKLNIHRKQEDECAQAPCCLFKMDDAKVP